VKLHSDTDSYKSTSTIPITVSESQCSYKW